jgi:ligand-binding sensor protein
MIKDPTVLNNSIKMLEEIKQDLNLFNLLDNYIEFKINSRINEFRQYLKEIKEKTKQEWYCKNCDATFGDDAVEAGEHTKYINHTVYIRIVKYQK